MRALILAAMLFAVGGAARAQNVTVYTMGPGDDLFSAFGHAAICVDQRCYNFGTADFGTPLPLTWDFIRGRARFWVSEWREDHMLAAYAADDRSVWAQRLVLDPAATARVVAELAASTDEKNRFYLYHHFNDNCTTRIRDVLARVLPGRLRNDGERNGPTFREYARRGFAGSTPLLMVVDLLLGRPADKHTNTWDGMFLPSVFREQLAAHFDSIPNLVVTRRAPIVTGSIELGRIAFLMIGAVLALIILVGRSRPRLALAPTAIVLGLIGLILWGLAILSSFPELRLNENLALFWPTDFALLGLKPSMRAAYLRLRMAGLALIGLLHLLVLIQPLAPALLLLPLLLAFGLFARLPARVGINLPHIEE